MNQADDGDAGCSYSYRETGELRKTLGTDQFRCPRCGGPLEIRPVTAPGVAYVRSRIWVECRDCACVTVLDAPA